MEEQVMDTNELGLVKARVELITLCSNAQPRLLA